MLKFNFSEIGPLVVAVQTNMRKIKDFGPHTVEGILALKRKYNILVIESCELERGRAVVHYLGPFRVLEWADMLHASVSHGVTSVAALSDTISSVRYRSHIPMPCGILITGGFGAEMPNKESYAKRAIEAARRYPKTVMGFVTMRPVVPQAGHCVPRWNVHNGDHVPILNPVPAVRGPPLGFSQASEDRLTFTPLVNDTIPHEQMRLLGQIGRCLQGPEQAIESGSDFVIIGQGALNGFVLGPAAAAQMYRLRAWSAYLVRIGMRHARRQHAIDRLMQRGTN